MKIVVLADNITIGERLQKDLGGAGYTVVVYYSPSEFLEKIMEPAIASRPFDLMMVDFILSEGISGREVIRRVRDTFSNLPIILFLAGRSRQIEAARRALPTVRVLQKPFSISAILAMIHELKDY